MALQPRDAHRKVDYVVLSEEYPSPSIQPIERPPMPAKNVRHHPLARWAEVFSVTAWLFEIVSFCLALGVIVAVVVVLAIYNGRPNPLWTGGITLNTAISFAAVLFRISLMVPVASCISQLSWIWLAQDQRPLYDIVRFDRASRSAYGSLKLLFSHHIRYVSIENVIDLPNAYLRQDPSPSLGA